MCHEADPTTVKKAFGGTMLTFIHASLSDAAMETARARAGMTAKNELEFSVTAWLCGRTIRSRRRGFIALFAALMAIAFSLPVRAQVAGGMLSGTITDSSGAAVIADVQLKNI